MGPSIIDVGKISQFLTRTFLRCQFFITTIRWQIFTIFDPCCPWPIPIQKSYAGATIYTKECLKACCACKKEHSRGYGKTGCRVFKRGIQNWKKKCLKINIPKGIF